MTGTGDRQEGGGKDQSLPLCSGKCDFRPRGRQVQAHVVPGLRVDSIAATATSGSEASDLQSELEIWSRTAQIKRLVDFNSGQNCSYKSWKRVFPAFTGKAITQTVIASSPSVFGISLLKSGDYLT